MKCDCEFVNININNIIGNLIDVFVGYVYNMVREKVTWFDSAVE